MIDMAKSRHIASRTVSYLIAAAGAIIILLPFYVTLITAFKTPQEPAQNFFSFPKSLYLENFKTVFAKAGYKMHFSGYSKFFDFNLCPGNNDFLCNCPQYEEERILQIYFWLHCFRDVCAFPGYYGSLGAVYGRPWDVKQIWADFASCNLCGYARGLPSGKLYSECAGGFGRGGLY